MTRRLRSPRGLLIVGLLVLGGLGLLGGRAITFGGFSAAVQETTTANPATFQSATQLLSDSVAGSSSSCLSSSNGASSISSDLTTCSAYPLNTTKNSTQTVALSQQGSVAPTSVSGATAGACGVQQVSDVGDFPDASSTGTNTGIPQGSLTPGVPGPTAFTDGPTAVSFDGGSTGYIETSNEVAAPGPQTFSLSLWFKTTSVGVPLMGFSNVQTNAGPSDYDRMLWIDGAGHLVFGVYPGTYRIFSSASTTNTDYADGNWHQVTVTLAPVSASVGTVFMYADGTLVAGFTGDETLNAGGSDPAQNYAGWWHLGWANTNSSWYPRTSSDYYRGSLADVAILPTALSAAQVSALASATTQSSESSTIMSDNPTSFWPLQQSGDPAIPLNGVAFNAGGPSTMTSGYSLSLSGTGDLETLNQIAAPQTFSLALWFKTSSDGSLMQFSTSQLPGSGTADRGLWLDSSGQLVFYLDPGGTAYELISPSGPSYSNNAWHQVVVTATPTSATTGTVLMYVDGSLVAGSSGDETITSSDVGATTAGYWQLGTSQGSSQSNPPSLARLTGSLSNVAVVPSVLSSSQISTLYGETTEGAYESQMLSAGPTSYWAMQDSGAGLYTGTIADVGGSTPCSYLGVSVSAGGNCLYPAQSGSCTTTTPLSSAVSFSIPTSLPTLTLTTSESSSMPTAAAGLHLSVPWMFSDSGGGFSANLLHQAGYVTL